MYNYAIPCPTIMEIIGPTLKNNETNTKAFLVNGVTAVN